MTVDKNKKIEKVVKEVVVKVKKIMINTENHPNKTKNRKAKVKVQIDKQNKENKINN